MCAHGDKCGNTSSHGHGGRCQCPNAKLERLVEPCLLLSLAEQPSHGYELMERLAGSGLGLDSPDPGLVYRTLRRLEELGTIASEWETEGTGPARRLYQVTPEGMLYLAAWRRQIDQNICQLQEFTRRYGQLTKE